MPADRNDAGGAAGDEYSLASLAELVLPCLDAADPAHVVEVGAFEGDFTAVLLEWARGSSARVSAVEPSPPAPLLELAEAHPELTLVRETSMEALPGVLPADAVVIDGDHNHFTVTEELRLIAEAAEGASFPLVLFHDVAWPHARRDSYYDPDRIPAEHRQPLARDAMVAPGDPGIAPAGIRYPWVAEREGGPGNGVLTAIEDFLEGRPGLRLAVVPAFFGLGVLWPNDAPWAGKVETIIGPWRDSELVARLEAERVGRIVDGVRLSQQEAVLRDMLNSRAFSLAERLSAIRQRGRAVLSREKIRKALGETEDRHP